LAIKDENGFVSASRSGLARIANISIEDFNIGIKCLESPDSDSRTPNYEGRRIEKIDGGWIILNNDKYRLPEDKRNEYMREYMRKRRNVNLTNINSKIDTCLPSVSVSVSGINSIELKNERIKENTIQIPMHLLEIWPAFEEMRRKLKKPLTTKAAELTIKKLNELSADHNIQVKILEQSIQQGWQGVFPLKDALLDEKNRNRPPWKRGIL
jgi:hypothetical protein